jgi:hypothetical protein
MILILLGSSPACGHTYSLKGITSHLRLQKACPVAGLSPIVCFRTFILYIYIYIFVCVCRRVQAQGSCHYGSRTRLGNGSSDPTVNLHHDDICICCMYRLYNYMLCIRCRFCSYVYVVACTRKHCSVDRANLTAMKTIWKNMMFNKEQFILILHRRYPEHSFAVSISMERLLDRRTI